MRSPEESLCIEVARSPWDLAKFLWALRDATFVLIVKAMVSSMKFLASVINDGPRANDTNVTALSKLLLSLDILFGLSSERLKCFFKKG
jgi:hypothetical protein